MITGKVLNPMGWSCPNFLIEQDTKPSMPSCPILTLQTRDVPRHTDQDTETMVGWSYPELWMVSHPSVLWDVSLGLESMITRSRPAW